MTAMPSLETTRLIIRPFVMADLAAIHQILDIDLAEAGFGSEVALSIEARAASLRWSILNYGQLAQLYQPPYGDRAIVLKATGQLMGACGCVPCLMPFEQLPGFSIDHAPSLLNTTEFGLYYALSPAHQRHGCATEAARALIEYAFQHLNLKRIIATTSYDNVGSIGVMRKLGMRIDRNPRPDPAWLQIVGQLNNPSRDQTGAA